MEDGDIDTGRHNSVYRTDSKYEQTSGKTFSGQRPSCNYRKKIWETSGFLSAGQK